MLQNATLAEKKPNFNSTDTGRNRRAHSARQETDPAFTPAAQALIARMPDPAAALAYVQRFIRSGAKEIVLITSAGRMIGMLKIVEGHAMSADEVNR